MNPQSRQRTTFGKLLRKLRQKKGVGIKKLAPDLNLDYTYISRLENDKAMPSEDVIGRVSEYFDYNRDELMILADRVPEEVKRILRENPREAIEYLRERFAGGRESTGKRKG